MSYNYEAQDARAREYLKFIEEEFVDVMQRRGIAVEIFGDEIMVEGV